MASPPLPYGWKAVTAPDGRMCHENTITKATQWERPMLPPGWSERIIPRSKQVFYIDHHHKLTTWVQPLNHLPPGWFALTAPDGRAYFQNSFLEITQFKRPTELPRGWVACKGADGKIYYQDNESKVTQWVIPTERLPKGWRAMTARNGRTYYRDDTTKSTTWIKPTAVSELLSRSMSSTDTEKPSPKAAKEKSPKKGEMGDTRKMNRKSSKSGGVGVAGDAAPVIPQYASISSPYGFGGAQASPSAEYSHLTTSAAESVAEPPLYTELSEGHDAPPLYDCVEPAYDYVPMDQQLTTPQTYAVPAFAAGSPSPITIAMLAKGQQTSPLPGPGIYKMTVPVPQGARPVSGGLNGNQQVYPGTDSPVGPPSQASTTRCAYKNSAGRQCRLMTVAAGAGLVCEQHLCPQCGEGKSSKAGRCDKCSAT
eukprot:m.54376 g.54376  ORF g.54376 m.54376 type:complete len:424 (+) comp16773_c0_seq2:34-1305(+)